MIFDIVFLIFIGLGFFEGYRKGVIFAVFSVMAWFIGLVVALRFSYMAVKFLNGFMSLGPKGMSIAAFIIVFIIVVLLVKAVGWSLEQILKAASLDALNQVAGGVIHSLISFYVFCILTWFMTKWEVLPQDQTDASHVFPVVKNMGPTVMNLTGEAVPYLKKVFHEYEDLLTTTPGKQATAH